MAHDAGIDLIGIHSDTRLEPLSKLRAFLGSEDGHVFKAECARCGIDVEYEQHILMELLPRHLFSEHPEYFRVDEDGRRNGDYNMCFTNEEAKEIVQKNAVRMAGGLQPSSHRYSFWTDDVQAYCGCEECSRYSPSEQVLIYENALVEALREHDPEAMVAHLAYVETVVPPATVKPSPGVFLEFAPIERDYTKPMEPEQISSLKGNLEVFPPETARVLEYWLDVSLISGWKSDELEQPPWSKEQLAEDVRTYAETGVQSITTFAAFVNGDYSERFGKKHATDLLNTYGEVLSGCLSRDRQ